MSVAWSPGRACWLAGSTCTVTSATCVMQGGFAMVPSTFKARWASGGSRVSMFGSHGNTMAVLSGAKKPQGVQLAGFLTEDGQLFPPGCGRSRARTRGGGSAAKLASVASSAMATANTLAGVMSEHIALQRDQLRVQDRHCKCSRPLFQMPLCSGMQEQWLAMELVECTEAVASGHALAALAPF